MEITQDRIDAAYAVADDNQKKVLDALFGYISGKLSKEQDNRPVTERIKTFEDAVCELGDDHPLVATYNVAMDDYAIDNDHNQDIVAYLKLRIVVAALNEGWTPQFVVGEYRWAPWFKLYTNSEIDQMEEEEKASVCRVVGRAGSNADALGGLACAVAVGASSYSGANFGSRLAFKTCELAEYSGRQFIELYRDMMIVL